MSENNYKRKEGFWFGLGKIPLLIIILGIASLIFYSSVRYLNPDFENGYLSGNKFSYVSVFRIGLIVHLIIAPFLVFSSSLLLFFKLEKKSPRMHRVIGRLTVYSAFVFLVPSGFILSYYAIGGLVGQILFFSLTLLTSFTLARALFEARNRNFTFHRKWMIRFYILLTSAIWLRINMFVGSYFFQLNGVDFYLASAALSWIPQLIITELIFLRKKAA
jgi:uncharacterized membrane protein